MLALRPCCEHCNKDLPPEAEDAMICSFECTFCLDCVQHKLHGVCPNCGGNFASRPIRPLTSGRNSNDLAHYPAQTTRIYRPVDLDEHAKELAAEKSMRQNTAPVSAKIS